jgi:hypothetical protein
LGLLSQVGGSWGREKNDWHHLFFSTPSITTCLEYI